MSRDYEIDEDPYLIESWEEYCKLCIRSGNLKLFKSKLGSYICHLNKPIQADLEAFCVKIQGEIYEAEMLRKKMFPNI